MFDKQVTTVLRKPETDLHHNRNNNSKYILEHTEPDNGHKTTTTTKNSSQQNDRDQLNLKLESDRLKTFKDWSNGAVTPESLAQAGFYSLNKNDFVKCAFCNTEGGEWVKGDVPMNDHKDWNPECPFVRSNTSSSSSSSTSSTSSASTPNCDEVGDRDVCGYKCQTTTTTSVAEKEAFEQLKKIGVGYPARPCSYDSYATLDSRLRTYEDWPKSIKQKPDQLSKAGFFYKGIGDQTMCFQCGGGLKDWEENDDPWEQHALWFPNCHYLILKMGEQYINSVQEKFKATSTKDSEKKPVNDMNEFVPKPDDDTSCCKNNDEMSNLSHSATLCKICYKNEMGVIFIPCGHVVACVECSMSLKNMCPVCRKEFKTTVRAFLS